MQHDQLVNLSKSDMSQIKNIDCKTRSWWSWDGFIIEISTRQVDHVSFYRIRRHPNAYAPLTKITEKQMCNMHIGLSRCLLIAICVMWPSVYVQADRRNNDYDKILLRNSIIDVSLEITANSTAAGPVSIWQRAPTWVTESHMNQPYHLYLVYVQV